MLFRDSSALQKLELKRREGHTREQQQLIRVKTKSSTMSKQSIHKKQLKDKEEAEMQTVVRENAMQ